MVISWDLASGKHSQGNYWDSYETLSKYMEFVFLSWHKPSTRPGKHSQFANLKMAIEIVDVPSYKMVMFHCFLLTFTRG